MLSQTSRNFLCRARWSVQQFGWSRHTQPDHFRRELRTARRCQKRSVRPTRSSAAVSGQPHRTVATVRQGAHAALSEPDRGSVTQPSRLRSAAAAATACAVSESRKGVAGRAARCAFGLTSTAPRSVDDGLTLCTDAAPGGVSAVVGRVGGGGWRTNVSAE